MRAIAFDGQVLYSSNTGLNFLEGLVTPDGRIHGEDWDKLSSRCGYPLYDVEVNSPSRLELPPEPQRDEMARSAAEAEIGHLNLFRLAAEKSGYFWLSFDQAFKTQDAELHKRVFRFAEAFIYWVFLALGLRGLVDVVQFSVIYAIVVTCLHLPFVKRTGSALRLSNQYWQSF